MDVISARGITKRYGSRVALDNLDLEVSEGTIVGIVGPNGSGKTTALTAIAGLIPFDGHLEVLGVDPWKHRSALMRDVAFIPDVAVLPRWIRVSQLLDYVAGVHPRLDRDRAESLLGQTGISRESRVGELSKGMVTQLHLSVALSIDGRLLILDEPTLGLDPLFRKQFYDTLLGEYLERKLTVIITTNELTEMQHVLTDVVFMGAGRAVFSSSVEEIDARFVEVSVHPDRLAAARALDPIYERPGIGRTDMIFDGADKARIASLGTTRTPSIPDLFVAVMNGSHGQRKSA